MCSSAIQLLPNAPACIKGAHATLPRIREAIDFWHERKWPVIYLYREYRRDGSDIEITRMETFLQKVSFCIPGTPGAKIADAIAPVDGDSLVMNNRFSGFMDTELDFILSRLGIRQIDVCGTQYPCCVRSIHLSTCGIGRYIVKRLMNDVQVFER